MQYLKRLSQLLLTVTGLGISLSAWADGTDSGTAVTNDVQMTFTVGATAQTASSDVTFVVDRKLRLDVGTPNGNWVSAVPGQAGVTASSVQFAVVNNSNDSVDVVIALIDQGALDIDGYDPAAASPIAPVGLTVWEDTNADGVLDGGENVLGSATGVYTLTGTFAEDEERTISVSVDVDGAAVAEQYQTYTLVAAVADTGVAIANDDSSNESPGVADVPAALNDLATVEVVFADDGSTFPEDEGFNFLSGPAATGAPDGENDGQSSNAAGFRTVGVLGIVKYVEVLWDPISENQYTGTGNTTTGNEPKSIPGAVLMYVIGVSNQSALAATGVVITDNVPAGAAEPLQLGNSGVVAGIELPDSITVDIDGIPVVLDLDNAGIAVDDLVYVRECSLVASDAVNPGVAFAADPSEVNASMGASCDGGATGYIVYFATVDNTAS
jgi:uncharacterized repeat protein (TIGR01451 family)